MNKEQSGLNAVELATELTIAWLSNPNTLANASEVPNFIRTMHNAVTSLTGSEVTPSEIMPELEHVLAVSIRKSLGSRDHIISLIDGKPYKMLLRHLARQGLTPDDYRKRYRLKPDYPMVAPAYADQRREMAKKIGLGRKRQPEVEGEQAASPKLRRGRPTKSS